MYDLDILMFVFLYSLVLIKGIINFDVMFINIIEVNVV